HRLSPIPVLPPRAVELIASSSGRIGRVDFTFDAKSNAIPGSIRKRRDNLRVPMDTSAERQAAFQRLYREHYRAIVAYALRRRGAEDGDDLVAETFLVAWRRLEDIPGGELTRPWLYAVARRTLLQRSRTNRRRDRLVARLQAFRRPEDHSG